MASAEIHKEKVFDARLLQPEQRFAVVQGGANVTAAPYNAIAATTSQHSFNINVPSLNIFTDRNLLWNSNVYQTFSATQTAANPSTWAAGNAIASPTYVAVPGKDFALCAYPLLSMLSTAQATINDTSVVANLGDTLKEILRLRDYKKNRLASSCPKIMDRYAVNSDGAGTVASSLGGFENFVGEGSTPNGAWFNLFFTDSNGGVLTGGANALGQVGAYAVGAFYQMYLNGIPIRTPAPQGGQTVQQMLLALTGVTGTPVVDAGVGAAYTLYIKWAATESIVLSPFIFASGAEYSECGIFGINNIQLVFNIDPLLASRVVRAINAAGGPTIGQAAFFNAGAANGFEGSRVMVSYITPPLSLELPALSSVPYIEYPRYVSQGQQFSAIAPGASQPLQSQTITVPYIPDALVIWAKPTYSSLAGLPGGPNAYGDFYLPLDYATNNPLAIQWDNRAGILSTHTHAMLHKMSIANGLDMDYETWSGVAFTADDDATVSARKALVGGPLVIRYATDIPLLPGQSCSIVGNYTLSYVVTVRNNLSQSVVPALYTMILGSGFFQTRAGSSRVIKGILTEADVVAAPMAPEHDVAGMRRMVGHGIFDRLGSMLSKAKHVYTATKPAMSALKDALPEGMVKDVMGKVGYGPAGAGSAGAGKRKGLAARLM
jgi:hypothetical protein